MHLCECNSGKWCKCKVISVKCDFSTDTISYVCIKTERKIINSLISSTNASILVTNKLREMWNSYSSYKLYVDFIGFYQFYLLSMFKWHHTIYIPKVLSICCQKYRQYIMIKCIILGIYTHFVCFKSCACVKTYILDAARYVSAFENVHVKAEYYCILISW